MISKCKKTIELTGSSVPQSQQLDAAASTSTQLQLSYKLVGDNIDKSVKTRYMRLEGGRNQSLHYFHCFAVLNRIDFTEFPDVQPQLCLNSPDILASTLLPSAEDDQTLRNLHDTCVSHSMHTHSLLQSGFRGCGRMAHCTSVLSGDVYQVTSGMYIIFMYKSCSVYAFRYLLGS